MEKKSVKELMNEMEEKGTPVSDHNLFDTLAELNLDLGDAQRFNLSEFLTSDDASVLMPRVLQGTLREAAEPQLIFKQFFNIVRLTGGNSIEFPSVSAMVAGDIAEGQEYPKALVDFGMHRSMQIRVGKFGLAFGATDEAISDSLWDVISMLTRAAGRAMARWEEQKRANAFHTHAHVRFDGDATAGTDSAPTGYGYDPSIAPGSAPGALAPNQTLSTMDWIEMIATLMAHDFAPTNVLMHPLYWPSYAKTIYFGGLGNVSQRWSPKNVPLGEQAISAALPFTIQPILTPRIHFNKALKVGDLYVVDRSEIGVELVKEDLSTEEWREPAQDIRNIKVRARKGWGILNKGRAIIAAKNIAAQPSYDPTVQFVHSV